MKINILFMVILRLKLKSILFYNFFTFFFEKRLLNKGYLLYSQKFITYQKYESKQS